MCDHAVIYSICKMDISLSARSQVYCLSAVSRAMKHLLTYDPNDQTGIRSYPLDDGTMSPRDRFDRIRNPELLLYKHLRSGP